MHNFSKDKLEFWILALNVAPLWSMVNTAAHFKVRGLQLLYVIDVGYMWKK